jgi:hypothetical protein
MNKEAVHVALDLTRPRASLTSRRYAFLKKEEEEQQLGHHSQHEVSQDPQMIPDTRHLCPLTAPLHPSTAPLPAAR